MPNLIMQDKIFSSRVVGEIKLSGLFAKTKKIVAIDRIIRVKNNK